MLAKFDGELERWRKADPSTPVQPALHLIAVVAQGSAGKDGMWRARMSDSLIERVYSWAQRKNAILFLDVQVGHSTLQQELPRLAKFLKRPDVHLGIDPEFSMKTGAKPGTKIGTFDAADVNYADELPLGPRGLRENPAQGARRAPLHSAHADEHEEHSARSEGSDRDQHGRLGPAVDEARLLSRLRVPASGAVHGVQAVLPQRHEEGRTRF